MFNSSLHQTQNIFFKTDLNKSNYYEQKSPKKVEKEYYVKWYKFSTKFKNKFNFPKKSSNEFKEKFSFGPPIQENDYLVKYMVRYISEYILSISSEWF